MSLDRIDAIEQIPARTIVTRTKSSAWFGAEYNMNIYRGCSHGCIYCDSRSDCYRERDFGRVKVKADALRVIRDDLRKKRRRGVISTGSMSDPYNPLEATLKWTRHALELIAAFGFGVAVATKSPLVARDADVLTDIGKRHIAIVQTTITCADDALCKKIEPHVAPSSERFEALARLADAGVFCGVLMMPLLPWITDTPENISAIVATAASAGARFVYPSLGLTLRSGNREYLYAKLDEHFPGLKERYIRRYATRYACPSPDARNLWDVFRASCERHGILYGMGEICAASRARHEVRQRELF